MAWQMRGSSWGGLTPMHLNSLSETEFTEESLEGVTQSLRAPERFWSDNLAYPGRYLDDYAATTVA